MESPILERERGPVFKLNGIANFEHLNMAYERKAYSISYQISTHMQVFVMLSTCIGLKCSIGGSVLWMDLQMNMSRDMACGLPTQGSLKPKLRFLNQKMCSVAQLRAHRQTDTKVTTVGTLSGFQEFFLQPIIKDQPNMASSIHMMHVV